MSNYGVTDAQGQPFKTKAAFRRAVVAAEPIRVVVSSIFEDVLPPKALTDLGPSDVIVGPDVFNQRDWYANVKTQARTGKITIT